MNNNNNENLMPEPLITAAQELSQQEQHHGLENIAAISGEFFTNANYGKFYDTFGSTLNGITGVYDYVLKISLALTNWERRNPQAYEEGADWLEITEAFSDEVISQAIETVAVPDNQDLEQLLVRITDRFNIADQGFDPDYANPPGVIQRPTPKATGGAGGL